jgi:hypothetical protein
LCVAETKKASDAGRKLRHENAPDVTLHPARRQNPDRDAVSLAVSSYILYRTAVRTE